MKLQSFQPCKWQGISRGGETPVAPKVVLSTSACWYREQPRSLFLSNTSTPELSFVRDRSGNKCLLLLWSTAYDYSITALGKWLQPPSTSCCSATCCEYALVWALVSAVRALMGITVPNFWRNHRTNIKIFRLHKWTLLPLWPSPICNMQHTDAFCINPHLYWYVDIKVSYVIAE